MNQKCKIILAVSVLLNVLLVGFIAGQFSSKLMHHPFHKMKDKEEKVIALLNAENQDLARGFIENLKQKHEANFAAVNEVMNNLKEIAKAENFDKDKFLAEMTKVDVVFSKTKKESSVEIAEFLSKLSQKERVILVEEFSKMPHFSRKFK
jgi:uncharacterized membrane protein